MNQNDILGFDVDGVLANFIRAFLCRAKELGYADRFPAHWTRWKAWLPCDVGDFLLVWRTIENDPEFWLGIEPLDDAYLGDLPVACYCTARPVPSEVTAAWLHMHASAYGFPAAPVYTVGPKESKLETLQRAGVTLFIDDKLETWQELNEGGIRCLLRDAMHNRRHEDGSPVDTVFNGEDLRIFDLGQVEEHLRTSAEAA